MTNVRQVVGCRTAMASGSGLPGADKTTSVHVAVMHTPNRISDRANQLYVTRSGRDIGRGNNPPAPVGSLQWEQSHNGFEHRTVIVIYECNSSSSSSRWTKLNQSLLAPRTNVGVTVHICSICNAVVNVIATCVRGYAAVKLRAMTVLCKSSHWLTAAGARRTETNPSGAIGCSVSSAFWAGPACRAIPNGSIAESQGLPRLGENGWMTR